MKHFTSIPSFCGDNKSLTIGISIIIIICFIALFPFLFSTYDPIVINSHETLSAPSYMHIFGTDNYGRDVFTRVIYATRIDLLIGFFSILIPFIIGTILGLISGYYGGKVDSFIMSIVDVFMAFPFMVLAIAIVAVTQAGLWSLFIALWVVGWKEYTRLVRSEVLSIKNESYVEAAKVLGFSDFQIIFKTILPNAINSSIVYCTSDIVMCIISAAAMSFLGLGVQAPTPEWGAIISDGKTMLQHAWWISVFPGFFILLTGCGFILIGDGLSNIFQEK